MFQDLMHLLSTQPHLLAGHAQAYGELAAAEVAALASQWRRRLALLLLALCLGGVALALAGTALLLYAVTPPGNMQQPWLLWLVPLLPAAAAAACVWASRDAGEAGAKGPFGELREQAQADLAMLREVTHAGGAP